MTASGGAASSVRAGAGMRLLRAAVFAAVCVVLAAAGHTAASGRTVPVWSLALGWLAVFAVVAPLAGRERSLPGIAAALAVGQLALHTVFATGQACASLPSSAAGSAGAGTGGGPDSLMAVAARLVCHAEALTLTPGRATSIVRNAGLDPAALGAPAHSAGTASMAGMPGMGTRTTPWGGLTHTVLSLPLCSLPMLLAHLLAAVLAGWLLRRGEAALWRLVRLSVRGAAELAVLSPAVLRRARALLSALAAQAAGTAGARLRVRCTAGAATARHRTVWLLRHAMARRGPPMALGAA
ncbi:MAG TPA: hypothetical protein VGL02_06320 [Streptomyces sp.]